MAASREGRLYLIENTDDESKEELLARCQQEALTYVSAINDYVIEGLRPYIKDVWQSILTDDAFAPMLVMRKGRMQGHLNRYIITNIVFHLKALDIYQCDNLLELHKMLEGVNSKNSIYKSAGMYSLNRVQRQRLREMKNKWSGLK